MTKLNEQILNMLKDSDGHLTAEQAFLRAKALGIDVSMASVYRILSKLAEEGNISKIHMSGQPDVFDKTPHNHGHLKCSVCGKISDLDLNSLESVLKNVTGLKNMLGFSLCIDYICDDCNKDK